LAAPRLERRVPADAEQIPRLRAAVAEFVAAHCGHHSEEMRQMVALAVTEACANVVLHAYPDTPGDLSVTAWVDEGQLTLVIADDGVGLTGPSARSGLGLGLRLMHELGNAHITSDHRGTQVRLIFPRC
jgi:two-component sensor histidine kinase